jgi:hypothetical protein
MEHHAHMNKGVADPPVACCVKQVQSSLGVSIPISQNVLSHMLCRFGVVGLLQSLYLLGWNS